MRILCLGDSLTEGTVGAGYIQFLEEYLPGHQYVNLGVNGDTIAGLRRRAERLSAAAGAEAAFIWIGTNDVMMHPDWVGNAAAAEEDYRVLLRAVSRVARHVFTAPPVLAGRAHAETYEYSLGRATEVVRRLSAEAGCRYVDIQQLFAHRSGEFSLDGAHLNEAGARLVAEVLAEHLRTVLD
jgi:lysophospholipase L1-like esterase